MNTLSRTWTAGIAYVALAVGVGLSIMYNIVDTMQARGPLFDWLDLVTAIAAPGVVLLMVHMFVSRIWDGQRWNIQAIRWMATVAIGGVAMRTSWAHGHDLMVRRGQAPDVATLWPLAIDLLAIMATALILAGRRGHMANGHTTKDNVAMAKIGNALDTLATGQEIESTFRGHDLMARMTTAPDGALATQPDDPSIDPEVEAAALARWQQGYREALEKVVEREAFDLDQVEEYANTTVTSKPVTVPPGVREFIISMINQEANTEEIDQAVIEMTGKSMRTVRRYRTQIKKEIESA